MKLETDRLILRLPREEDVGSLVESINNLNIIKWLLAVPYPYTEEDAKWWIEHCKEEIEEGNEYNLNIQIKGEKGIVGGVGLSNVDERQGTAEIGYWLDENYHRKGIMTEAATRMINFAFDELEMRRLYAPIFADNEASQSLAKKLGFEYEGRKRKSTKCKATGKIHDEAIYGLLREDWENRK